jgi:hypothetical protein
VVERTVFLPLSRETNYTVYVIDHHQKIKIPYDYAILYAGHLPHTAAIHTVDKESTSTWPVPHAHLDFATMPRDLEPDDISTENVDRAQKRCDDCTKTHIFLI